MFALKIISIIHTALLLRIFVSDVRKSKDTSESIGYKVLSLLQAVALAYIIMN